MLRKNEVFKWLAEYDLQKYPVTVYHELVVEQRPYLGRIEILGAWKTGCLKTGGQGRVYVDRKGAVYSFTARWNPKTPVGYSTWREIAVNEEQIKEKIPLNCPITKPAILAELESRKGFGFIWARLNNFMAASNWVHLANNVEKLNKGEEKQGVGWFLHEQLGWSIMDSQLSSHLGVILTLSGAWEYNGKKIGIGFRRLDEDWRSCVRGYYNQALNK